MIHSVNECIRRRISTYGNRTEIYKVTYSNSKFKNLYRSPVCNMIQKPLRHTHLPLYVKGIIKREWKCLTLETT